MDQLFFNILKCFASRFLCDKNSNSGKVKSLLLGQIVNSCQNAQIEKENEEERESKLYACDCLFVGGGDWENYECSVQIKEKLLIFISEKLPALAQKIVLLSTDGTQLNESACKFLYTYYLDRGYILLYTYIHIYPLFMYLYLFFPHTFGISHGNALLIMCIN